MVQTVSLRVGLLLLSAAHLAAASLGPDVIFCPNHPGPVHFSWTVPDLALDKEVVGVSPGGEAMFSWTKDFLPLDEYIFWDRVDNVDFKGANIRFSLSEVRSSDGGLYSCRENSVRGPVIPDCGQTLHYIEVPSPRIIQWGLPVVTLQGRIRCYGLVPSVWKELGLEFLYEWFMGGLLVARQEDVEFVLSPLQFSDEGRYTCRVTETTRNCSTSAESIQLSLNVAAPPTVRIQSNTSDLDLPEGSSLTLTCKVESAIPRVPPDGFVWSFSPSDSSPARQLPHTGRTLTLGPMTREDRGQYTCQAWNDQHFKGQIPPGHDSVNVSVYYLENLSVTSDVEVREGEDFTLTCSVDSSPTALLQWLVDGVLRRYVTANLDRYVVVKATRRDSGTYTCRAAIGRNFQLSTWTSVTVTGDNDGNADGVNSQFTDTKENFLYENVIGRGARSLASRLLLLLVTSTAILLC